MTSTISRSAAILAAAQTLAAKILLAIPVDRAALTQAMTEAAGGSDADGFWQQRDSFQALEAAITLTAHELTSRCDGASAIRTLEAITRELPTHTVRSEDQIEYQQFSTPPALAMLAIQLARLTSEDVFLEPSAGTGIIASLARPHVATPSSTNWSPPALGSWKVCFQLCPSPGTTGPGSARCYQECRVRAPSL